MLTYLHIKNYKSLKDVKVRPSKFCVLVGANAAGKTNFVDCLDFLGRCFDQSLARAIAAKGGYENVAFRRARRAKGAVEFTVHAQAPAASPKSPSGRRFRDWRLEYHFAFRATQQAITGPYEVTSETIKLEWSAGANERERLVIDRKEGIIDQLTSSRTLRISPLDYIKSSIVDNLPPDELLLASRLAHVSPFRWVVAPLARVGVYQISTTSARNPGDPSGRMELGRTGTNLPAVIQHLRESDPKAHAELLRHLQKSVATFTGIETDYVETRQLGLFLKEKGVGRRWIANDLSDGTLRTLAIFVPLLDSRLEVVAIEEPENSIHPWVIEDFVQTCRKRASKKQIVVTTHSPILVSHVKPSELLLVDRIAGETRIFPAQDVDRSVEEIIRDGVQDLGAYWNSGQMSAVPAGRSLFDLLNEANGDQPD